LKGILATFDEDQEIENPAEDNEQPFSELNPPCTKEREVQTEMTFSPYDCFYCEKRLLTQDQVESDIY
jgi:hypothetical protein